MKNRYSFFRLFVLILFGLIGTITAQSSLFIPRNILDAYEKGTRSFDGKPGPKYWVNHSDYTIKAEIIPETRSLKGHEWITYYNNHNECGFSYF